jgi:hypothetical protein
MTKHISDLPLTKCVEGVGRILASNRVNREVMLFRLNLEVYVVHGIAGGSSNHAEAVPTGSQQSTEGSNHQLPCTQLRCDE